MAHRHSRIRSRAIPRGAGSKVNYQQYPGRGGYPAQYPGYPPPQPPRPSGATAIIAGVLAVLGGLWHLLGVVGQVLNMFNRHYALGTSIIAFVIHAVLAGLLLTGGILLFARKPAGRMLTLIGAALAVVSYTAEVVLASFGLRFLSAVFIYIGPRFFALLLMAIPAAATIVLVSVPPTTRWLSQGRPTMMIPPAGPYRGWS